MGRLGAALLLSSLCSLAAIARGHAQDADDALVHWVESSLSAGVEPRDASQQVVALGAPGEQALVRVFEREQAARYVRLRALALLGSVRTETAARYLEGLVKKSQREDATLGALHPARSALVLRRALDGLAEGSAQLLGAKLDTRAITSCLAHSDAHVRKSAADLLATLDGAAIDRALVQRLEREPSKMVRGTLSRALTDRSARRVAPR